MKNRVFAQLKRFLFVGAIAVCLDWSFYLTLTHFLEIGVLLSKSLSYMIGTIFAFIANGMLVFQSDILATNFLKHLLLYIFSLLANTWIFTTLDSNFDLDSPITLGSTLFVATLASTVINFIGMRYWVFNGQRNSYAHR